MSQLATAVHAQVVTWQVVAHMVEGDSSFTVGDKFVAAFTFNSADAGFADVTPLSDKSYDAIQNWSVVFERGYQFGGSSGRITLGNDKPDGSDLLDRADLTFWPTSALQSPNPIPVDGTLGFFQISLEDRNPGAGPDFLSSSELSDFAVPVPSIIDFPSGRLFFSASVQPRFVVESVTAIPEPPAFAYGAVSLLGVIALRAMLRRERKTPAGATAR